MFEPPMATSVESESRPDPTPGPDHMTSAVTAVSTAAAAEISQVRVWTVPAVPMDVMTDDTVGLGTAEM